MLCYVIIPLLRHFTILGQMNVQNMPRYYTVERDWAKIRTESKATKWLNQTLIFSEIVNPLFDGLTYNNIHQKISRMCSF